MFFAYFNVSLVMTFSIQGCKEPSIQTMEWFDQYSAIFIGIGVALCAVEVSTQAAGILVVIISMTIM